MKTCAQIRKRLSIVATITSLIVIAFAFPTISHAAACTGIPAIGNVSLSNCTLTVSTVTGADQAGNLELSTTNTAVLTAGAGASITINSGGTSTLR